ncbi:hypothetical protein EGJ09_15250 [Pseudomonas sp. p106]|nr:hypothetical protein EGJ09_15250 [Pseudomonas sp. p106]
MLISRPFTLVCPECSWKATILPGCDSRPTVPPPTHCPTCQALSLGCREATQKEVFKARLEEFLALEDERGRDTDCRAIEDNGCK